MTGHSHTNGNCRVAPDHRGTTTMILLDTSTLTATS
jgi:hypothetical protein